MIVTIERLGVNGEGVGHWEGLTVFVDGALPGEEVVIELYEKRKRFGRARVIEFLNTSPHRVKPLCPVFGLCGGCQLMHMDNSSQLLFKRERVVDALERIGKLSASNVLPCLPSPSTLAYRNKIQLPVSETLRLGLYAQHTHQLIEVEQCGIHCALGDKAYAHIQRILAASSLSAYHKERQTGELRHVLIKTAIGTKEVLVVLVTSQKASTELRAVAEQILQAMPEVRGVVHNYNPSTGNVILGDIYETLAGEGFIHEVLCELRFKVSPASFFQVNPEQAERVYRKVVEYCALKGDEVVLDAYCGVGTLSLILAKQARAVIGVESVLPAIQDAEENRALNAVENARFICGQAEKEIAALRGVNVAVLNPPRKGCEPEFLSGLVALKPEKIVYLSCDPATLARDLNYLCSQGYVFVQAQPFDMFPQTAHVETLALLEKLP